MRRAALTEDVCPVSPPHAHGRRIPPGGRRASAATRNAKVYAEFTDGRTIIGRASKAEDPGHFIIDGEDVDIAKIWKTAELPLSVKSIRTEGVPSDSDSL